ncbi:MAG: xanthine dehydrogenase family protein subunit M [Eubacteriales bacterium]
MKHFQYVRAGSLDEAYAFLADHPCSTRVMAGGTDLLVEIRMNERSVHDMDYILDISGLKSLTGIREKSGIVTIGALTTHEEVHNSPLVQSKAPLLAEACGLVGGPQTRARGTVGGNICNLSPCADSVTALTALDAVLSLSSLKGNRQVPIHTFLSAKEKDRMEPGELLTEISFGVLNEHETCAYIKLGRRKALAIARMNTGAIIELKDGIITNARVSVGAAFPHQRRLNGVEAQLIGKKPDEKGIQDASREAAKEMLEVTGVRWSTEYKEPVIQTLVKRCIEKALKVE